MIDQKTRKSLEKKADALIVMSKELNAMQKKAMKWLVVAVLFNVAVIFMGDNLLAMVCVLLCGVLSFLMHRSYDKEADDMFAVFIERGEALNREHLRLIAKHDPDGLIRSITQDKENK